MAIYHRSGDIPYSRASYWNVGESEQMNYGSGILNSSNSSFFFWREINWNWRQGRRRNKSQSPKNACKIEMPFWFRESFCRLSENILSISGCCEKRKKARDERRKSSRSLNFMKYLFLSPKILPISIMWHTTKHTQVKGGGGKGNLHNGSHKLNWCRNSFEWRSKWVSYLKLENESFKLEIENFLV